MIANRVNRVIETYSARRKALLLAEHNLRLGLYRKQLLTNQQFRKIFDSIKSGKDVDKFNETRKHMLSVNSCVTYIRASFSKTLDAYNILGLLSSQLFNYLNTEQLLTLILDGVDDKITLAKVKGILKKSNYILSGTII